jgi:energy-coupling factor transporter ATP-binding protein EcfA2
MITQLKLENYRCFDKHTIELRDRTVVVGRNNAGKSTIVEALTLLSHVVNKVRGLQFTAAPDWLELPRATRGVSPAFDATDINLRTIFHRYGDPPAKVMAVFASGDRVQLYVGNEHPYCYATFTAASRQQLSSKSDVRYLRIEPIHVLPQVGPLAADERTLREDYVKTNMNTRLGSLHFRNQMLLFPERFEEFKGLAESTWRGLRVNSPELAPGEKGSRPRLSLLIGDGDFVAEAAWMGHGIQMWLQTMWFMARVSRDATVILDEPDVYMHPDLQRKLYRLLHGRFRQTIVATHSVEIMSEAEPKEILVIDRSRSKSNYTNSEPAVQHLIEHIGGVHNVHLARLWSARRLILVEGDDLGLLKIFYSLMFFASDLPLDSIPNMSIGGWGGWNYAVGSTMLVHNSVGDEVVVYCILDSDYFLADEITNRLADAKKRSVSLHIWSHKEIENYLLNPQVIARFINEKADAGKRTCGASDVRRAINRIAETLKEEVIYGRMERIHLQKRNNVSTAHKTACAEVDALWKDVQNPIRLVSGKAVLGKLSDWSKRTYGVSFGANALARSFTVEEIDPEMQDVLTAIQDSRPFV